VIRRVAKLHDTAAMQKAAGVIFYDYEVGQRVRVKEGFVGTVTSIQDGPFPNTEEYEVVLDSGMGGGTWSVGELTALSSTTASSHMAALVEEEDDEAPHLASQDYPELTDILVERPPLENSVRVLGSLASQVTASVHESSLDLGEIALANAIGTYPQLPPNHEEIIDFEGKRHRYSGPLGVADLLFGVDGTTSVEKDGVRVWTLNNVALNTTTPDRVVGSLQTSSGFWNIMDKATDALLPDKYNDPPGYEYAPNNWCRFRNDHHRCMFPKTLNIEATKEAGYNVWNPEDRGYCPRNTFDAQQKCPISQPGENSGDPNALINAFTPWEQGGQRGGIPVRGALLDEETSDVCPLCEGRGTDDYEGDECELCLGWKRVSQPVDAEIDKTSAGPEHGRYDGLWAGVIPEDPMDQGVTCAYCGGQGYGGIMAVPRAGNLCGKCHGLGFNDARMKLGASGTNDDGSGDYVECNECGHALEAHSTNGCRYQYEGCTCDTPWTEAEISRVRRENGLPGRIPRGAAKTAAFELTAKWSDIQAKAKRIRAEGGVRIISASPQYVVAEVKGDHNIYQTTLQFEPGTKRVAMWSCGCAYSAYAWGRSGRWTQLEGRECSHAYALQLEAGARGMFGKDIIEDANKPQWRNDPTVPVIAPGDYKKVDSPAWRVGARRDGPLPIEDGLYYRSHPTDAPFGRGHAITKNIGEPPSPEMAKYWEPKPGYSAFWNPHHIDQYHDEMGWDFKKRKIVAFRGKPIGEGADGEPRVMPDSDKPEFTMTPAEFHRRLDVTENGYGRWNEHTWGEGPKGQQVDDGYRSLNQIHGAKAGPVYYHGEDDGARANTGDPEWDNNLFASHDPEVAKLYGPKVTKFQMAPDTKVAKHDNWMHGKKPVDYIREDKAAGYDVSEFHHPHDFVGHVIHNPSKILSRTPHTGSFHPVSTDPELADPPATYIARAMLEDGTSVNDTFQWLALLDPERAESLIVEALKPSPFKARVDGTILTIVNVTDEGAVLADGRVVPGEEVIYPTWDPNLGLSFRDASLHTSVGPGGAAGVAVKARDTGRVLLVQRASDSDDPASGTWELPGGHVDSGEDLFSAAKREFEEETGRQFPSGEHGGRWTSPNGKYIGFVWVIPSEDAVPSGHSSEIKGLSWFDPETLPRLPSLRDEAKDNDWDLVKAAVLATVDPASYGLIPVPDPGPYPLDGSQAFWEVYRTKDGFEVSRLYGPGQEYVVDPPGRWGPPVLPSLAIVPTLKRAAEVIERARAKHSVAAKVGSVECPICGSDHTNDSPEWIKALHSLADTLSKPYSSPSREPAWTPADSYGGYISQDRSGRLLVDGKPLSKLYRVVHPREWEEAQRNGYLQSNTPSSNGYTRASAKPDERWRRQSRDQMEIAPEGHTLEIDYDPADQWHASAEGYAATHAKIPMSRVRKVGGGNHTGAMTVRYQEQGKEGRHDHITRDDYGTLPTEVVANMPGKMGEVPGEHRNMHGQRWEDFKEDIRQNGMRNGIFIGIDWDGEPTIYEGNHRRDAAVELGMTEVPANVRYFGCAERQGTIEDRVGGKPVTGGLSTTAAGTGVMICLTPPEDVSQALLDAYDGPNPESIDQMHVTMLYMGKPADVDEGRLQKVVESFALEHSPLTGDVNGWADFHTKNDGLCLVALWNIVGLSELVAELRERLHGADITASHTYDFHAHTAVAYHTEPVALPSLVPEGEAEFNSIWVAYGGEWTEYEFGSGEVLSTETKAASLRSEAASESAHWAATRLRHEAEKHEREVTPLLQRVAQQTGMDLNHRVNGHGALDFKLKSHGSLADKIEKVAREKAITHEEAAKGIGDVLRYTMTAPTEHYTEATGNAIGAVRKAGHTQANLKNYWAGHEDPYDGINTNFKDKSGYKYELQFHTPESIAHKESIHHDYEVVEGKGTKSTPQERQSAWSRMTGLARKIPVPHGVVAMGHPAIQPRPKFAAIITAAGGTYRYFVDSRPPLPDTIYRLYVGPDDVRFERWDGSKWLFDMSTGRHLVYGGTHHDEISEEDAISRIKTPKSTKKSSINPDWKKKKNNPPHSFGWCGYCGGSGCSHCGGTGVEDNDSDAGGEDEGSGGGSSTASLWCQACWGDGCLRCERTGMVFSAHVSDRSGLDDRRGGGRDPCLDVRGSTFGSSGTLGRDERLRLISSRYTIFVTKAARRDYMGLPDDVKRDIKRAIVGMKSGMPSSTKALVGGGARVRVGDYRIVIGVAGAHVEVRVIAHRSQVYSKMRRRLGSLWCQACWGEGCGSCGQTGISATARVPGPRPQYDWAWRQKSKEMRSAPGAKCYHCGATTDLTVDHVMGQHDFKGLRVACRSCNSSRGAGEQQDHHRNGPRPDFHDSMSPTLHKRVDQVSASIHTAGHHPGDAVYWDRESGRAKCECGEDVGGIADDENFAENLDKRIHEHTSIPEGQSHHRTDLGRQSSAGSSVDDEFAFEEEVGPEATLHESPEPALPSTDGAEEQERTDDLRPVVGSHPPMDGLVVEGNGGHPEPELASSLSWIMNGSSRPAPTGPVAREAMSAGGGSMVTPGSMDIAAAAREALAKMGTKTFNAAEQQQIIQEGEGDEARNLADLVISGTYYEAQAILEDEREDSDDWALFV
jgi:8-oxo-dGTP pyrophosphatase MutT (NUDIX family)/mRNA-degrading endonuclease RelE of RelBE toxin-antitoxin system/2'-5' RNA ligase